MPQMINYGDELIRISPKDNRKLEYSRNDGVSWNHRFTSNNGIGRFLDLMDNGKELLATTDKGLFYSKSKGASWNARKRN